MNGTGHKMQMGRLGHHVPNLLVDEAVRAFSPVDMIDGFTEQDGTTDDRQQFIPIAQYAD